MTTRPANEDNGGDTRGRRLDVVLVLAFIVMMAAGMALFPLSVASNQLSGLWITLCASLGLD